MAETTVETAVYRLRVEGQDQIDRLTKSIGDLTVAEEKVTTQNRTTSDDLQKRLARYDPLIRAQQAYTKELRVIATYQESGVGTQKEINALFEGATSKYKAMTAAINQVEKATVSHTNATKLQGYQMLNLSRQLQDVGVSLFGGQSPLTVAVQQIPQITDISQQSGVSMVNMFKQAGSAALAFVTPVRVAIGAVAALAAGVGYLASQWSAAQREARLATAGIGGASGTSVGDINRFAQRESSYGGLTTGQARAAAIELTKTGDIVIDKLHGVGQAIHGFATLTNTEVAEATKRLAQDLSGDLVKGMDDLNKVTGDFNAKDRAFVASLQAAGKETEAQQFMIDKMSGSLRKAAAETGFWSDQWHRVQQAVSSAAENLSKAFSGGDLEERLAKTKAALDELEKSPGKNAFAIEMIDNLKKKVAELNAEMEKNAADSYAKQMNKLSSEAQAVTEKLIPQIAALREAQNELAKLQAARQAGQGDQFTDILIDKLKAYTEQLGKAATATALLARETASQSARNVAALGEAATAAEKAQARIDALTASFQSGEISANVYARAVASIRDQLSALADQGIPTAGLEQMRNTLADITKLNRGAVDTIGDMGRGLKDVGVNGKVLFDESKGTAEATAATAGNMSRVADDTAATAQAAAQAAEQFERAALATQQQATALAVSYKYGMQLTGDPTKDSLLYRTHTWETGVSATTLPQSTMQFFQNPMQAASFSDLVNQQGSVSAALAYAQGQQAHGTVAQQIYGGPGIGFMSTGGTAAQAVTESEIIGQVQSLYDLMNQQTQDKGAQAANLQAEMAWLQTRPQSIEQQKAIASLRQSIDQLTNSTDSLNATNQELLSPYYTQDPRTSHIGFRSQGMALGGYVDVPGGVSSNDNMIATIPVASGERIYIDPMNNRRSTGSGGSVAINISSPVYVQGNVNREEFGRTLFQSNQNLAKQIIAATGR